MRRQVVERCGTTETRRHECEHQGIRPQDVIAVRPITANAPSHNQTVGRQSLVAPVRVWLLPRWLPGAIQNFPEKFTRTDAKTYL
jgi:hypothetical protein